MTAMWRNFLRERKFLTSERFSYVKERDFEVERIPPWGDLGESFEEDFYVFGVVRHEFISKESATGFGDEHIIFDADASEVFELFDFVKVEELCVGAFFAPEVDEIGDEIDARFVSDNVTGLEFATEAQTCESELRRRTSYGVITDIDLSESFHVVNVHSHGVS